MFSKIYVILILPLTTVLTMVS